MSQRTNQYDMKKTKSDSALPSEDRENEVLLYIKQRGSASIAEMAAEFSVSDMTIRRVLYKLADRGAAIRTPGGAMVAPSGSMERSFLERSAKMASAKERIGHEAAQLVHDGETIILDSGTTTRYIARHLGGKRDLTVITTSLAVLEELAGSPSVSVRLTGGIYRRGSHDLAGPSVIDALAGVFADKVFFGAAALSFKRGIMNYDAEMPKLFLRCAREKILVIDSSKIGTEATYRLCGIEGCSLIVTDNKIRAADAARLRRSVTLMIAQ